MHPLCLKILFILFISTAAQDYCNMLLCSNPERHVMCLYPNLTFGSACASDKVRLINLDINYKTVLVQSHRAARRLLENEGHPSSAILFWDEDLAKLAERWAAQCPSRNDECRSLDKLKTVVYQNVETLNFRDTLQGTPDVDPDSLIDIVSKWYTEENNPIIPSTDAYRKLDLFGCAVSAARKCSGHVLLAPICIKKVYFVCNYGYKDLGFD